MTTAQVVEMSVIVNYSPIGYKGLVNRYRVGGGGVGGGGPEHLEM